jgi:hypothetical protein
MKNLPYFQKFKLVLVFLFAFSIIFQSCKTEEVKPNFLIRGPIPTPPTPLAP